MNVDEPSMASCGAGVGGMLLWTACIGCCFGASDEWLEDESVELSLTLICTASSSSFFDIDLVPDSRGIPSVTIGSPLPKFNASSTATQDPTKKIKVPITLEAGVAYGVSVEKSVVGAINGSNKKNPFTTNTAEPMVNETPTR